MEFLRYLKETDEKIQYNIGKHCVKFNVPKNLANE